MRGSLTDIDCSYDCHNLGVNVQMPIFPEPTFHQTKNTVGSNRSRTEIYRVRNLLEMRVTGHDFVIAGPCGGEND